MGVADETVTAEVKTPWGSLGGKNLALNTFLTAIGVAILVALGMFSWFIWQSLENHRVEAKEAAQLYVGAMKEQTVATKELAVAQREQNCLLQFEQKDRPMQANNCARNAR